MQNNKSNAEAIAITAPDVASTKIAAHRHLSVIDSIDIFRFGFECWSICYSRRCVNRIIYIIESLVFCCFSYLDVILSPAHLILNEGSAK
jgi:hypothetical protein